MSFSLLSIRRPIAQQLDRQASWGCACSQGVVQGLCQAASAVCEACCALVDMTSMVVQLSGVEQH